VRETSIRLPETGVRVRQIDIDGPLRLADHVGVPPITSMSPLTAPDYKQSVRNFRESMKVTCVILATWQAC
jgi:hypothetical protein